MRRRFVAYRFPSLFRTNAYTGLHQAIHELRHGSVAEAKQLRFATDSGVGKCVDVL